MEGKRRVEEDMQDSLMVKEGMMVKIPLGPFCYLSRSPAAPASRFFTPAPEPACVDGRFVMEIMLLLDGISVGGKSTIEREGSPL